MIPDFTLTDLAVVFNTIDADKGGTIDIHELNRIMDDDLEFAMKRPRTLEIKHKKKQDKLYAPLSKNTSDIQVHNYKEKLYFAHSSWKPTGKSG